LLYPVGSFIRNNYDARSTERQKKKIKIFEICFVARYEMSLEAIQPPSKEVLEKVRGEFGLNEQRVRDAVEHLKDWIRLQPHLPKEIGTFWLRHFGEYHKVHNSKHINLCSKYFGKNTI